MSIVGSVGRTATQGRLALQVLGASSVLRVQTLS